MRLWGVVSGNAQVCSGARPVLPRRGGRPPSARRVPTLAAAGALVAVGLVVAWLGQRAEAAARARPGITWSVSAASNKVTIRLTPGSGPSARNIAAGSRIVVSESGRKHRWRAAPGRDAALGLGGKRMRKHGGGARAVAGSLEHLQRHVAQQHRAHVLERVGELDRPPGDRAGAVQDLGWIVPDDPGDGDGARRRPQRGPQQRGHALHPAEQGGAGRRAPPDEPLGHASGSARSRQPTHRSLHAP